MSAIQVDHQVEGAADAPALLLINSLGSDRRIWQPLMPALLQHCRVIRYDQRGHGASPAPKGPYSIEDLAGDALALLDRLGVARARVRHFARRHGGHVVGAACQGAGRSPGVALHLTAPRPARSLARARGLGAHAGHASGRAVVVDRWFTAAFAAREPDLIAAMIEMVASTPLEGYAASCEAIERWDWVSELARIHAPTWVLAGAEDPATPPPHAYWIGALLPGARVSVIERAAHLAFGERPRLVGRSLLEHLQAVRAPTPVADAERAARGETVRRAVLGDAHVDRAQANTTSFTAPFQDYVTRVAWGDIWSRPGLSRAERSIVTLSCLAALHHDEELAMHVRAALRNGLTVEQIQEVLLQVGLYAGVPAANRAFATAQRVAGARA